VLEDIPVETPDPLVPERKNHCRSCHYQNHCHYRHQNHHNQNHHNQNHHNQNHHNQNQKNRPSSRMTTLRFLAWQLDHRMIHR
jgi:hypothetical protein